jgi:hypothetical protein
MLLRVDAWIAGNVDASADTAKATLPVNPLGHERVIPVVVNGEGVYVENDGSTQPLLSGITATTIDVRGSVASKDYVIGLMDISGIELQATLDNAAT